MSRYAQPMSQVLSEMKLVETTDPKIVTTVNSLKKNDIVRVGFDSSIKKGHEGRFKVTAHNVIRGGRVTKTTLQNLANPKGVKHFIYQYQGKQGAYFAIGDMGASMTSLVKEELEEGYESEVLKVLDDAGIDGYFRNGKLYVDRRDAKAAKDALEDADNIMKLPKMVKEEVELEEMKYTHAVVDPDGKVAGMSSNEKDAKDIASRHKGKVVKLKKPMAPKKGDMMINRPLEERMVDPADVDDDATDADKKAADKNIIMQMRKAMDVKGNMPIEFGDGKKEKVDPKILQLMVTAHGKIQKPRDKEKFVAMIGKSKRDMLTVAKKLATLKMDLDKEDEPVIKKVIDMLKKASGAHAGQAKDLEKAMTEETELDEGFSPKQIKMAIGIASDPRYKGGNYTGAFNAIEKIKKGLASHPQVAAVLKRQNEDRVENFNENYRKLAMMGIGTETKKAAKVGLKTDYYLPKNGDKSFGKITRVTSSGYEITDEKTKKVHKFKFYDPNNDPTSVRGTREEVELDEKVKEYQGVAYFKTRKDAEAHMKKFAPKGRVVEYERGYAVQTRTSGPYLNKAGKTEEVELGEKYELYHKTFSDAMQHAYDYAKKTLGITVDPKEIDNKVATGPRKPSEGKTNKYRLKGKGGNLQIQVYNKGGSKPFELNMYKEENEMKKSLKDTILEMRKEGFASDAQRKAAFASGYKEKGKKKDKEEGNEFSGALDKARKAGKKTFKVGGKEYPVEPAKKESIERYHETKQGSLRESILKMWGEVNEKVEYVEYKFKNERDAKAAKAYFDGIQLMSFDVNDDNIRGGELMVDAGSKDMTKYHKEVMKKFRPKVMTQEKKDLTKEKKDDTKKMTDTGKEVTPVETSVKMPKIKETKNKV